MSDDLDLRYISKDGDRWRVRVPHNGQRVSLGVYDEIEQAIESRNTFFNGAVASREAPQAAADTESIEIPENANLIATKPLHVSLERWLYASDLHAPLHNRQYIKRLILVALHHCIDTLVLGGDIFDFDCISAHPKTEQQTSLNQTLRIGGDLLVALGRYFRQLYLLPGNHDARVAKKLDQPLEFAALIHAAIRGRIPAERLVITDYDYIRIDNWIVGHPRFYSSVPAKGVAAVAQIQQANIIGAHNHIVGMTQSPDGRYWAIDPGHMTDPELTPYLMRSAGLSKYSAWKNGFVMVDNNIPRLFSDGLTDWSKHGNC